MIVTLHTASGKVISKIYLEGSLTTKLKAYNLLCSKLSYKSGKYCKLPSKDMQEKYNEWFKANKLK